VVWNNKNTIKNAIDSVLNQTYKNIEYIIIDGDSTDGTVEIIVYGYGVKAIVCHNVIYKIHNIGSIATRNLNLYTIYHIFKQKRELV
jgi:glycosyltransferase involved in cell wall biosynthesis